MYKRQVLVLLSGLRPGHDRALQALGVAERLRAQGAVFPDSVQAIEHARTHLAAEPARPAALA